MAQLEDTAESQEVGKVCSGGADPESACQLVRPGTSRPPLLAKLARGVRSSGKSAEDIFYHNDFAASGTLSREAFIKAVLSFPVCPTPTVAQIQELFCHFDNKSSGEVDKAEFCRILKGAINECHSGGVRKHHASTRPGCKGDPNSHPHPSASSSVILDVGKASGPCVGAIEAQHDGDPISSVKDSPDGRLSVTEGACMPLVGGDYTWVTQANGHTDRALRREVATETMRACEFGGYALDEEWISLKQLSRMVDGTCLVRSHDLQCAAGAKGVSTEWFKHAPALVAEVAVASSSAGHRVAAVNAASAYHAGGGFKGGGRHALEESLCVRSTLFKSLAVAQEIAAEQGVVAPAHVDPGKGKGKHAGGPWHCHIPVDGVVLSPHVEVFRGGSFEGYPFWSQPVELAAIISVAMPNSNQAMADAPLDAPRDRQEYLDVIAEKFTAVLVAAARTGADVIVMPDVGCGVYGNNPTDVGRVLGEVVRKHFPDTFTEIHLVGKPAFADAAEAAAFGLSPPLPMPPSNTFQGAEDAVRVHAKSHRLREVFRRWDASGNGTIDKQELARVLRKLDARFTDAITTALFKAADVNRDGAIDYEEFLSWILDRKQPGTSCEEATQDSGLANI